MAATKKEATDAKRRFHIPRLRRGHRNDEKLGYFAGAWYELKQVRWPNRSASWGLTIAVVLFSLTLGGLTLGLDFVFYELFRKVI